MTDPASFILARLLEDEYVAHAAGGNQWAPFVDETSVDVIAELKPGSEVDGLGVRTVAGWGNRPDARLAHMDHMPDAQHIARHNPARVLAEVEAKRALVEQCMKHEALYAQSGGWPTVLRVFALSYSDHPEFDEAWRP